MRADKAEAHASAAHDGEGGRNLPGAGAGAEDRSTAAGQTKPEAPRLMEAVAEAADCGAEPEAVGGESTQTLRTGRGRSLKRVIEDLNPLLRGWVCYFRLTEGKGTLDELDGWLRHKLRTLLWRRWKRKHTRARNLMRAGRTQVRAWPSATNGRGPWWNGDASHMNAAYPKSWFDRMGLVSLLDFQRRFSLVS